MRVAVVGSGGVGGYYGGRLAAAGLDVAFLARGAHLAEMRARGLRIESPQGDVVLPHVSASDDPADIGPVDLVLFCVKLYDTATAATQMTPLIGPDTTIVCLQNGVDGPGLLADAHGVERIVPGTVYLVSELAAPGQIRHSAVDRPVIGAVNGIAGQRLAVVVDALRGAGSEAELSDHIHVEIWRKFVRLCTFSAICCATRLPIGPILADADTKALFVSALEEAVAVAAATGVPIDDGFVDESLGFLFAMTPDSKPSMLRDLEAGRRLELSWLSGTIARLGAHHGVPTPIHTLCWRVLRPYQDGAPANVMPQQALSA